MDVWLAFFGGLIIGLVVGAVVVLMFVSRIFPMLR